MNRLTYLGLGLAAAAAAAALASTAPAQEFTYTFDTGATRTRSVDDSGNVTLSRSLTTANGGTIATSRVCMDGELPEVTGCYFAQTLTGAEGRTWTQEQLLVNGANRNWALGQWSGDNVQFGRLRRWRTN